MLIFQKEIRLKPFRRGIHVISGIIEKEFLSIEQISSGWLHVFIKHSTAGLAVNDNEDLNVREDFDNHLNEIVPEKSPLYSSNNAPKNDIHANIKSSLVGSSVSIPILNGKLNVGTWQGIYLCEFRAFSAGRELVLTAMSQ